MEGGTTCQDLDPRKRHSSAADTTGGREMMPWPVLVPPSPPRSWPREKRQAKDACNGIFLKHPTGQESEQEGI